MSVDTFSPAEGTDVAAAPPRPHTSPAEGSSCAAATPSKRQHKPVRWTWRNRSISPTSSSHTQGRHTVVSVIPPAQDGAAQISIIRKGDAFLSHHFSLRSKRGSGSGGRGAAGTPGAEEEDPYGYTTVANGTDSRPASASVRRQTH